MTKLTPIAEGLWTDGESPQLIAGKRPDGKIIFPLPLGDAAKTLELYPLSREGKLWSWTRQDFKPKPPYDGPEEFEPFLVGYIELPGEVIVESHIVGSTLEDLKLGMPMEFVIVPVSYTHLTLPTTPYV